MGQQASQPRAGAKMQVIGAGLSRTGTASFSAALSILLDGPVYHSGTQITLGPAIEIKSWIKLLKHFPTRSSSSPLDKQTTLTSLSDRLDGYVAVTDSPPAMFVPELLELYPEAKVICTVRDRDAWARSMGAVQKAVDEVRWMRAVLFLLPTMRHFVDYIEALRWGRRYLYGVDEKAEMRATYERHVEWLEGVVPREKLMFFDVRDGWGPLCEALGVEVPIGVDFPRINDGEAIERFAKEMVRKGLVAWACIGAVVGVGVGIAIMWRCEDVGRS